MREFLNKLYNTTNTQKNDSHGNDYFYSKILCRIRKCQSFFKLTSFLKYRGK